ncbi:MAG TPA: hypothetical protein VFF39_12720 [Verrucomicrobiae bacterium]|nr:hypothetical protein [Verrucomicrobiae bacterium]
MTPSARFATVIFLVLAFASFAFAQTDAGAAAALASSQPGYADKAPVTINPAQQSVLQAVTSATILNFPANADSSRAIFAAGNGSSPNGPSSASGSSALKHSSNSNRGDGHRRPNVPTIDGLDTLATFAGAFMTQAGPSLGRVFNFNMIGNHPALGGTTVIPAQITTVSLTLLNADGTVNVNVPFVFRDLFEDSPNFATTNYRSGRRIQYGDAVHRAQFFNIMGDDWHTVLDPSFVNNVNFTIPRFVNVRFPDGSVKAIQAYQVGTAPDGNHFVLMLDLLFDALFDNQVINDIVAGNFTTDALSMTLFPNTFLFSINAQGQESGCCVLGFHTFFNDPTAVPQPRWVTQFASWISPGLFGAGFEDVTALSHETAEAFANPFVNNATASWQFPGVPPTAKICQANLEEGDPIEVLPNASIPITLRERKEVFTYHPQIIPLLQWFEMGAKSNAIDGAFSFPDETTLPHSALPCPQ